MDRPTTLGMPRSGTLDGGPSEHVETPNQVVIVGANGSGKTRLGAWLEFYGPQTKIVHRVGAQKALKFPDSASPLALEAAQLGLVTGVSPEAIAKSSEKEIKIYQNHPRRINSKWQGDAAVGIVDDYENLLIYLVSEQYEVALAYTQQAAATTTYTPPTETKLTQIKRIWEHVISHRQLIVKATTVTVKQRGAPDSFAYKASMMSDGERVVFYLIGQCLAAPPDSIIIVDEPEIHLHRVIQSVLWDSIERERPDCLFVYLTHDLEFATSRTEATKIWIESYNRAWRWQLVPSGQQGLPEDVLLAVLGSRKPVLFTEGEVGGYEHAIFSRIYPKWTIMPCGNCEQVIDATQSFTKLKHLHGNECRGIIDRDYRDDYNVTRLQAQGVLVLETQEVENLMLDEAVLTAVLEQAISTGAMAGIVTEKLAAIKAHLFGQLARDQEMLTTKRASWEIEKVLRRFGTTDGEHGLQALERAVAATCALPMANIYQRIDQEFTRIITAQDYLALLRLYNNKGLAKRIGQFFNFREPFPDYFKRLLSIQGNEALVQALRAACPVLPTVAITA